MSQLEAAGSKNYQAPISTTPTWRRPIILFAMRRAVGDTRRPAAAVDVMQWRPEQDRRRRSRAPPAGGGNAVGEPAGRLQVVRLQDEHHRVAAEPLVRTSRPAS
jgi:hypothetical protein